MLNNGFPAEWVDQLRVETLLDHLSLGTGGNWFQKALDDYSDFVSSGLGLFFYGYRSGIPATLLAYHILSYDIGLSCYFVEADAEISFEARKAEVLVLNLFKVPDKDTIEQVIFQRESRRQATMICAPSLNYLNEWPGLNIVVQGDAYQMVEVIARNAGTRWGK